MKSISPHDDTAPLSYQRIEKAICYMRENHLQQPDLSTIAQQVNLSEYHFQRLFKQWAGISPKRFLQYLTVEHAKARISSTRNLLELSGEAGLSGPGRLHDLFVNLEAMTPGEYKGAGAGLVIHFGVHDTAFGACLIAATERGICNIHFPEDGQTDPDAARLYLQSLWPAAQLRHEPALTAGLSQRLFQPAAMGESPVTLHVKGTNFQIQVWRALLKIPNAGVLTYQGLAEVVGNPKASRAVGSAVGKNPVAYLIPCHRVIRATGELGGYRWGETRKTALLGWEAGLSHATVEVSG